MFLLSTRRSYLSSCYYWASRTIRHQDARSCRRLLFSSFAIGQPQQQQQQRPEMTQQPRFPRPTKNDDEYYIYQALRYMLETKPPVTVQVENANLTGCSYLPSPAVKTIQKSLVRIKVLTFSENLSDKALWRQIQRAEQDDENDNSSTNSIRAGGQAEMNGTDDNNNNNSDRREPVAVVAVSLKPGTNSKTLGQLRAVVAGAYKLAPSKVFVCGQPNAGKTSLVTLLTRKQQSRNKDSNNSSTMLITKPPPRCAGRTLGIQNDHLRIFGNIIPLVDSPGLRPRLQYMEQRHVALLLAARAMEPFEGYEDQYGEAMVGEALAALNRHAEYSNHTPPMYVERLGLPAATNNVSDFMQAIRSNDISGKEITEMDMIRMCQSGQFGGMLFWDGEQQQQMHRQPQPQPQGEELPPPPLPQFDRGNAVLYMNKQAKRLKKIGFGMIEVTPFFEKDPFQDILNPSPDDAGTEDRPTALPGEPIVYPRHRAEYSCLVCAGFCKRDAGDDGRIYGTRFTRVQQWSDMDIMCFFSRMSEAFGGLRSSHIRYLFRDSLACTMAMKHKLRSRAQAYKKVAILRKYPIPDNERPLRFRLDQPISLRFKCKRAGTSRSSCVDMTNESDPRHPIHYEIALAPKTTLGKKSKSTSRKKFMAERGGSIPERKGLHYKFPARG